MRIFPTLCSSLLLLIPAVFAIDSANQCSVDTTIKRNEAMAACEKNPKVMEVIKWTMAEAAKFHVDYNSSKTYDPVVCEGALGTGDFVLLRVCLWIAMRLLPCDCRGKQCERDWFKQNLSKPPVDPIPECNDAVKFCEARRRDDTKSCRDKTIEDKIKDNWADPTNGPRNFVKLFEKPCEYTCAGKNGRVPWDDGTTAAPKTTSGTSKISSAIACIVSTFAIFYNS